MTTGQLTSCLAEIWSAKTSCLSGMWSAKTSYLADMWSAKTSCLVAQCSAACGNEWTDSGRISCVVELSTDGEQVPSSHSWTDHQLKLQEGKDLWCTVCTCGLAGGYKGVPKFQKVVAEMVFYILVQNISRGFENFLKFSNTLVDTVGCVKIANVFHITLLFW